MTFNTIELLSIFSVFLFLFFAGYLLSLKTNKKLSNLLFAVYLIVIALDLTAFFYPKFITLSYTAEMLRMEVLAGLKSPILYLYILSVLYDNFKLKTKYILFFVPLFINLVVLFPAFFLILIYINKNYFLKITLTNQQYFLLLFLATQWVILFYFLKYIKLYAIATL